MARRVVQGNEAARSQGAGYYPLPALCAGSRGTLRKFKLCRICFRELALRGGDSRRTQSQLVGRGTRDERH